jgi:hypothetical protein
MNGWTLQRRLRQAALIRRWKPWEQSSGPKTAKGKAASRMNARKHGLRSGEWRQLRRVLALQARALKLVE